MGELSLSQIFTRRIYLKARSVSECNPNPCRGTNPVLRSRWSRHQTPGDAEIKEADSSRSAGGGLRGQRPESGMLPGCLTEDVKLDV